MKEEFGSILAPHVQYPSCSGNTFLNLILQSVLSLPKAGNRFTSRFHGWDWFNCRQDHWHSRTGDFIWHIICAEDPAGTSTILSSLENTIKGLWCSLTMLSLAGSVLVKGSFVEVLAAQVQYPVCSCFVLENLTEQSLLLFPKAGNCRTGNGFVVGVVVV